MSRHVILGAGPVAHAIVASLTQRGIEVDVVSRSGTKIDGARTVTANVLDTENLKSVVSGCDACTKRLSPGITDGHKNFQQCKTASCEQFEVAMQFS